MKRRQPSLDGVPESVLSTLAALEAKAPVTLSLLSSLEHAGAVMAGAKQPAILLDPLRAGAYDAFLCGRLLRYRGALRPYRRGDSVPSEVVSQLVSRAKRELQEAYPGLQRLRGAFQGRALPFVSLGKEVPTKRLPDSPGLPEFLALPGLEFSSSDWDYEGLLRSLENAELERVASLPELPVARIPLQLPTPGALPRDWERIEELRSQTAAGARLVARCMKEKTLGPVSEGRPTLRRKSGTVLDTNRLHRAALALRTGHQPAVFKKRNRFVSYVFDPQEHLTLFAFDLGSLTPSESGYAPLGRRVLFRLLQAFELLQAPALVVAFNDRLVTLESGRRVYLHSPLVLKEPDQPWDYAFWTRLYRACDLPEHALGAPASFPPLHQDYMRTRANEIAEREGSASTYFAEYFAPKGLLGALDLETPTFLRRVGEDFVRELRGAMADQGGTWWWMSLLPQELIDAASPGSYVADCRSWLL